METAAAFLMILGSLAGFVGDWMILVRAYRCGAGWFLGCLLLPFTGWLFASLVMPRPALPLTLSLGGTLLVASAWLYLHLGV
jgi:hypothetical protein